MMGFHGHLMGISWGQYSTFKSWDITPITKLVYLLPYFSFFQLIFTPEYGLKQLRQGLRGQILGQMYTSQWDHSMIILPFFGIQHIWNHQTSVKNEARSKSMSSYNAQMRTTGRCLGFLCRQIFQHHGVVTSTSIHWFGSTIHRC